MAANDDDTEEPHGNDGEEEAPKSKGRRQSFGHVRRELNEDELSSPGVQKMMLDELDRMDGSERELRKISKELSEAKSSLAVAEEKLKTHHAFDILSTGAVAAGTLIFGVAFSPTIDKEIFWITITISVILVGVGIIAKVIRS